MVQVFEYYTVIASIEVQQNRKRCAQLDDIAMCTAMSITKNDYDKKQQEFMDKQNLLNLELEEHTTADHDYKIHVDTVFNLARNMKEIFDGSEPLEKRAFLNFMLQNPTVSGKRLEFTMRKSFNLILELATCPIGLTTWDDVRTYIMCDLPHSG